jgi:hypothetical protein
VLFWVTVEYVVGTIDLDARLVRLDAGRMVDGQA